MVDSIKFDLVLIDVHETNKQNKIQCVVKDLYTTTYCTLSYRWGEEQPWQAQTPHYNSYIISFPKENILKVCQRFSYLTDYIWVDTISINQAIVEERKKVIAKMHEIYHHASHVIAIPDLGFHYTTDARIYSILKFTGVNTIIEGIQHYKGGITKFFDLIKQPGYFHLRDLVSKWSERAWVISERSIGENKTLVYILCMDFFLSDYPVFNFRLHDNTMKIRKDEKNDMEAIKCILQSKATVLKDRLSAIIPLTKYHYDGEDVHDPMSLRKKLFSIFDSDEGRASLLFYFKVRPHYNVTLTLPSFISIRRPVLEPYDRINIESVYCHIQSIHDGNQLLIKSKYYEKIDRSVIPEAYVHLLDQCGDDLISILLFKTEDSVAELICAEYGDGYIILFSRWCGEYAENELREFTIV